MEYTIDETTCDYWLWNSSDRMTSDSFNLHPAKLNERSGCLVPARLERAPSLNSHHDDRALDLLVSRLCCVFSSSV